MKTSSRRVSTCVTVLLTLGLATGLQAGAVHYDYDFAWVIEDYIDCTGEAGTWDIMVSEVTLQNETPSGKGHFMWHAWWEGTLTGHDTGYEWYTKGILQVVDRYALNGDPVGGSMQMENSILKPLTPGAPRILLDVHMKTTYNAHGDLVVDKFTYALNCLGKNR